MDISSSAMAYMFDRFNIRIADYQGHPRTRHSVLHGYHSNWDLWDSVFVTAFFRCVKAFLCVPCEAAISGGKSKGSGRWNKIWFGLLVFLALSVWLCKLLIFTVKNCILFD